MPKFPKLDEGKVARIRELAGEVNSDGSPRYSWDEISGIAGASTPSCKKYGAPVRHAAQGEQRSESVQQPQPAEPQMLYPGQIQPPSRRPETKTDLTPAADTATDAARLLHSVDYIGRMVKGDPVGEFRSISEMIRDQTEPLQDELGKKDAEISALRQQIGAEKIGSLKDYIDKSLASQEQRLKSQQELSDTKLYYEGLLAKKSEYREKTEAYVEMAKELPKIISQTIASTLTSLQASGLPPGALLGRARNVADAVVEAAHPIAGGRILEEPLDIAEVRRRSRVITPRRVGLGVELPRTSDEDLEDMAEILEDMADEKPQRDLSRERMLAEECARLRREVAELQSQRPQPSKPDQHVPEQVHSSRVMTVGKSPEPEVKPEEGEHA